MLLAKFFIAGKEWSVYAREELKHEDGIKCNGLTHCHSREIEVCSSLTEIDMWETFLHELMHAVLDSYFLDLGDEALEERICNIIGDGFTSALKPLLMDSKNSLEKKSPLCVLDVKSKE